ncbi:MAG: hypothetical protein PWQ97_885 [Tepidanaerobacteraceae bacterium]|nr:hypothetical protein [Tepidanaerobacteraceae bacterium]
MAMQTLLSSGTSFVSGAFVNVNFSASASMIAGISPVYSNCISLLQFAIPPLPVASVDRAVLRLFVMYKTGIEPTPVVVNRITSAFDMATVTYNAMLTFAATGSTVNVNISDVMRYVEIDVTALVNQWLDGTYPNYGMALTIPSGITEVQFGTKAISAVYEPKLVVEYSAAPAMLAGIQAQLQGSPGALIADNANVVFDTILASQSAGISYNAGTGEFTISEPGNYYISWWVVTDGSAGPVNMVFSIMMDASPVVLGNSPIVTGQVKGDALITVAAAPAVVRLVNQTGANVVFANTPVQANITIFSV